MSKLITTLLTSALLSVGCADQATELNDTAALDPAALDTGAFDTGDTAFESNTNREAASSEEGRPDRLMEKKPLHFDVDELQLYPLSEGPLDELSPL